MVHDIRTHQHFRLLALYVLKYNMLYFGDRSGAHPQVSFFQNNCHYMMIIYTVIKPDYRNNFTPNLV